jgi:hypothetical protein
LFVASKYGIEHYDIEAVHIYDGIVKVELKNKYYRDAGGLETQSEP